MNKKLYFSVCVSILCTFFAVLSLVLLLRASDKKVKEDIVPQNQNQVATKKYAENINTNNVKYYLAIYENGKINSYKVFENGTKSFYEELDEINVFTMRENDREMFKKGIALTSKEDLISLIEDYTG